MDLAIDPAKLDGWVPFRLDWKNPEPTVEWFYLGDQRFTDPFFTETMDRNLRRPFNLLFRQRTPISELKNFRNTRPGLTPSGFIFHLSRSGSTLVSQMLAAAPQISSSRKRALLILPSALMRSRPPRPKPNEPNG